MSDAETVLRNLLDACDRGRPLADIADRLRVEVGRLGEPTAAPTRPELRKHVAALRDEGLSFESAHAYQEARQALADAAEGLLDEIDRLSAAPTHGELWEAVETVAEWATAVCESGENTNPKLSLLTAVDQLRALAAAPTRPTREQVRAAIERHVCGVGWDVEEVDGVDEATDAVMALIGGDDA